MGERDQQPASRGDIAGDAGTGLPVLPTWKGVYVVVIAILAAAIGLLTWLTCAYR